LDISKFDIDDFLSGGRSMDRLLEVGGGGDINVLDPLEATDRGDAGTSSSTTLTD
jgi:hypothetical protein